MKWSLALVLFLVLSQLALGQKDSLPPGVIDGVVIPENVLTCDTDTIISFHENSLLVIQDSTSKIQYSFEPGVKSYCEIEIKTLTCRCKDCSFSSIIIVETDNKNSLITLSPENTTWSIWNSWRYHTLKEFFFGTLDLDKNQISLYSSFEDHPDLHDFKMEFVHKNLSVKN